MDLAPRFLEGAKPLLGALVDLDDVEGVLRLDDVAHLADRNREDDVGQLLHEGAPHRGPDQAPLLAALSVVRDLLRDRGEILSLHDPLAGRHRPEPRLFARVGPVAGSVLEEDDPRLRARRRGELERMSLVIGADGALRDRDRVGVRLPEVDVVEHPFGLPLEILEMRLVVALRVVLQRPDPDLLSVRARGLPDGFVGRDERWIDLIDPHDEHRVERDARSDDGSGPQHVERVEERALDQHRRLDRLPAVEIEHLRDAARLVRHDHARLLPLQPLDRILERALDRQIPTLTADLRGKRRAHRIGPGPVGFLHLRRLAALVQFLVHFLLRGRSHAVDLGAGARDDRASKARHRVGLGMEAQILATQ